MLPKKIKYLTSIFASNYIHHEIIRKKKNVSIDLYFFGEILIIIYVKMGNQESTKVNDKEYISSFMARTFILNHNRSHENIQLGHVALSAGFGHWTRKYLFIFFTIYFNLKAIFAYNISIRIFSNTRREKHE